MHFLRVILFEHNTDIASFASLSSYYQVLEASEAMKVWDWSMGSLEVDLTSIVTTRAARRALYCRVLNPHAIA